MLLPYLHRLRYGLVLVLLAANAAADNTAGVFGPVVNPNQEAFEYRGGFDPDSSDLIQRLHYQNPIGAGDRLRWRVVGQVRKTPERTQEFDFVQGELLWQLDDLGRGWQQAIRIDGRVSSDDRPGLVALSYIQDRKLGERWAVRGLFLTAAAAGPNRPGGLDLQMRAHLRYRSSDALTLGLEWFSFYGRSGSVGSWEEQVHQVGPYLTLRFGQRWTLFAGALFGATAATDDLNLRLWLTRGL